MNYDAATQVAEIAVYNGASQKVDELKHLICWVGDLEPKRILEIGSMDGGTLRAWRAIAPDANLISVSLTGGPHGGGSVPPGIADHHFDADSHDPSTLAGVRRALADEPVDFLFIDGDHSYEGVKQDFEMYSPLVRSGGLIAFHDILATAPPEGCYVKELWDDLVTRYETREFVMAEDRRDYGIWGGIGLIQW